ncbi:1-acyl-sn-glycerol-3-phosphate acyltransferase [Micromonospora fulviviridis]|uniref:lysophospholipid acyltransferase family protein n=1 Tax=Micromonospora fulviviridis TaxID=47860 RepID=UPI001667E054|nr:lysophospholipid acyltransferase family protein [Micromonospora fulviviridis]GGS04626.1 1-acyl-sn-glycerol-3-phosphate acyltransferase [Micromonospora fulviviridis]
MPELVYPPVILAAKTMFRALDLRLRVEGSHHVPRTGGAVLASNHVSYLDFIFCGYGAHESRRLVRFMAKDAVFRHKVSGPLMRGMKHIPVNRAAGAGSYASAVAALRRGEVVGVFPEATISRSLTVKELKNGAARMAQEAAVPLLPVALWGTQRLWTKGRPRTLTRRHTPITILIGEPIEPAAYPDGNALTAELRTRLTALVDRAQREYPDQPAGPDDAWWQPAHLGGSAPTPQQAAELDRPGRRTTAS